MKHKLRWALLIYDTIVYLLTAVLILIIYPMTIDHLSANMVAMHMFAGYLCLYIFRLIFRVYEQIWRYASPGDYLRMIVGDGLACIVFLFLRRVFPQSVTFVRAVALFMASLLGCIVLRLIYQWIYQHRSSKNWFEKAALTLLKLFTGVTFAEEKPANNRIKIAIVGAGTVGAMLLA